VIFTALLLAQFAPASTVTEELALGDAPVFELPVVELPVPEFDAAGAGEPPPLLHAARPVTAARTAMPPRTSVDRLLLVLVLSLFIGGILL
jgi:hypothetical protein